MEKLVDVRGGSGRAYGKAALFAALLFAGGCAGGLPSIPKTPEAILKNGEHYLSKGKNFQAQELFKAFLARFPGHDRSDEAQFMLAESYFNDEDYPLAAVEYRVLISNYGYSEYVDDALFKVGVCSYKQAPRAQLDQSKSFEALGLLEQFLQTFPNSPLAEEAREYVEEIERKLAEKDFDNAMFYYRHRKDKSAGIYFDKVIEKYPGNEYWVRALYYKGRILMDRGDKEGARRLFAQVLDYPYELDVKRDALEALRELRGRNDGTSGHSRRNF